MDFLNPLKKQHPPLTRVREITLPPSPAFEIPAARVWAESAASDPSELAFSSLVSDNRLKVLVVGAGFAGLSSAIACARQGFAVTVLERSSGLSPHGDNIQLGCNAAKIMNRWGIGKEMWERSARGGWWIFKDAMGKDVAAEDLRSFPQLYGAPMLSGHRGQFLGSLGVEARMQGVHIRLETEVTKYFDSRVSPGVLTNKGEIIFCDVVIVCDGVNSAARGLLTGRPKAPNFVADYSINRAAMKSDLLRADKKCAHLLDGCIRIWLGRDAHVMMTSMDDGHQVAFSFTHREKNGNASLNWRDRKPIDDVLKRLSGWDPILTRALRTFQTSLNWSIPNDAPGEDWISSGGRIAFSGDSVHPMQPTTFQGGSSAIEDGATLAICLALSTSTQDTSKIDVHLALRVYETLRRPRVEKAYELGTSQRNRWHSFETTKDINSLHPLTTSFYGHDAELHVLNNFEATARGLDSNFEMVPRVTRDLVWAKTGLNQQPGISRDWLVNYTYHNKPAM